MLSAFLWWISGCVVMWIGVKVFGISRSVEFQQIAMERILRMTYNQYLFLKDAIIMRNVYFLSNDIFTEDEVNDKMKADIEELDNWADLIIKDMVAHAQAGKFPYKLAFNDWKSACLHIQKNILKKE